MNREEAINHLLEKEFIVEKGKKTCYFCERKGWIAHENYHMGRTYKQTCPKCEGRGHHEKINYRIKEGKNE